MIEFLRIQYLLGKVSDEQLDSLLKANKITKADLDYIKGIA